MYDLPQERNSNENLFVVLALGTSLIIMIGIYNIVKTEWITIYRNWIKWSLVVLIIVSWVILVGSSLHRFNIYTPLEPSLYDYCPNNLSLVEVLKEIEKVNKSLKEKEQWYDQSMNRIRSQKLHDDPSVLCSQIIKEREGMEKECWPILNKPKPKVELPKDDEKTKQSTAAPDAKDKQQPTMDVD